MKYLIIIAFMCVALANCDTVDVNGKSESITSTVITPQPKVENNTNKGIEPTTFKATESSIVTTTNAPTSVVSTTPKPTTKPTTESTTKPTTKLTTTSSTTLPTTVTLPESTTPVTKPTQQPGTTPASPTPAPVPRKDRHFDGPSFIGGIVLAMGLMAIGFVSFKFYKARTERNYHTL